MTGKCATYCGIAMLAVGLGLLLGLFSAAAMHDCRTSPPLSSTLFGKWQIDPSEGFCWWFRDPRAR